jgi:hypothetical protein
MVASNRLRREKARCSRESVVPPTNPPQQHRGARKSDAREIHAMTATVIARLTKARERAGRN